MKVVLALEPAFSWHCPNCNAINYEGVVPAELTPTELTETLGQFKDAGVDLLGMDEDFDREGFFVAPEQVQCPKCQYQFETKDPSESGFADDIT